PHARREPAAMGADYFGVRQCSLYRAFGVDRFVELVKASALLAGLEESRGPLEAGSGRAPGAMPLRVVGGPAEREVTVASLRQELAGFPRNGIAECAACPISGGRGLGGYRYGRSPVGERCG